MPKTQFENNDDKILDRIKTRDRMTWRMVGVLTSGITLVFAAMATAIFSGHAALVTSTWGQIVIAAVVGALFVYAFVTVVKYSIQSTEAGSPRLVHRRTDIHQRRWRQSILLNVIMMFFAVMVLPAAFQVLRVAPQVLLLLGAFIAGFTLLLALIVSAGPGWPGAHERLNDEFDSVLRARMMRFGYILALLLLCAVLQVALWQPDLTLTALVWALYAGFAIPALYYLITDWRASRGGEG